jgi:hypothetical protein
MMIILGLLVLSDLCKNYYKLFDNFQGSMWGSSILRGQVFSLFIFWVSRKFLKSMEFGWIE